METKQKSSRFIKYNIGCYFLLHWNRNYHRRAYDVVWLNNVISLIMKKILKSYLITFISLFIFQESVNARECHGKVIGGPFSGKENIQISKFLEKSSFAIYSLLNIDLKKATADDVEKKWFDNFEKLNFKFPKVNLVRVYLYSGKGWSD